MLDNFPLETIFPFHKLSYIDFYLQSGEYACAFEKTQSMHKGGNKLSSITKFRYALPSPLFEEVLTPSKMQHCYARHVGRCMANI